ncbi:hypothetical protein HK102_005074 [Quaeritorhiza haematococci]|nr:hypothetical protein HK102_005074 [Quaeritorhiza haematococci]
MHSTAPQATTLTVAKESLAMAEKTGDKTFQRMALGLMALTGIGTLLHAVHELYRDIQPRRDKPMPAPVALLANPHSETTPHESQPVSNGGNKPRLSERQADGERLWADTISRQGHGRHR